jgi:hypothetical protein
MTTLLAAAMGLRRTPLDSAFRLAADPRFDAGPSGVMRIGLGWHVRQGTGGTQIVWHNGGTRTQLRHIQELKTKHGIDYDSHGSYRYVER